MGLHCDHNRVLLEIFFLLEKVEQDETAILEHARLGVDISDRHIVDFGVLVESPHRVVHLAHV